MVHGRLSCRRHLVQLLKWPHSGLFSYTYLHALCWRKPGLLVETIVFILYSIKPFQPLQFEWYHLFQEIRRVIRNLRVQILTSLYRYKCPHLFVDSTGISTKSFLGELLIMLSSDTANLAELFLVDGCAPVFSMTCVTVPGNSECLQ